MEPAQRAKWRHRARDSLGHYLRRHSYPRLLLSLILSVTGLAGFGISYGLLHAGLGAMWLRYPLATLGAYLACLALLRLWATIEHRRFRPERLQPFAAEPRRSGGSSSWLEALDFSLPDFDAPDDADGCLLGILLALILGSLVWIFATIVSGASVLLAEIFLDAFFVSALYRRLKVAAIEHWLGTALRRTWWHVLAISLLLSLLGYTLQTTAPGTQTIGQALHELFGPSEAM